MKGMFKKIEKNIKKGIEKFGQETGKNIIKYQQEVEKQKEQENLYSNEYAVFKANINNEYAESLFLKFASKIGDVKKAEEYAINDFNKTNGNIDQLKHIFVELEKNYSSDLLAQDMNVWYH